jgi:hypothetical protein
VAVKVVAAVLLQVVEEFAVHSAVCTAESAIADIVEDEFFEVVEKGVLYFFHELFYFAH